MVCPLYTFRSVIRLSLTSKSVGFVSDTSRSVIYPSHTFRKVTLNHTSLFVTSDFSLDT